MLKPVEQASAREQPLLRAKLFFQSFIALLRDAPGTAKRFWILVMVTGLASGLTAAILVKVLNFVQRMTWSSFSGQTFLAAVENASLPRRLLVPLAGGLLISAISLALRRPLKGHGTAAIIESIWMKSGRVPFVSTIVRAIASIFAVAMGAPLGREGALLQSGSATASWMARQLRIPADQARLLVACGAASGLAAAYNVPIGAALFGLEVFLGSFALELFGPIVVSCVVATLVSRILISNHPSYLIPHYEFVSIRELLLILIFGPLLGLASALYVRTINAWSVVLEPIPRRWARWLPVISMGAVGAFSIWFPQLLGNGYNSVNAALLDSLPLVLLLVLPALKLMATAICAASGVPGGMFTPCLFFGALLGGAFGHLMHFAWNDMAPPGAYALMGMAAILGGTTHAAVSSVLIIFELTGNYAVILPLMLTTVLSTAISQWIEPESLYTAVLKRRKVSLPPSLQPSWLNSLTVRSLLSNAQESISPATEFEKVVARLLELPAGADLYVTTPEGRLLGIILLETLKGHLPQQSMLRCVIAADVMTTEIKSVTLNMSLQEVALRFSALSVERLPVVDELGRLMGTVSKSDILRHSRF